MRQSGCSVVRQHVPSHAFWPATLESLRVRRGFIDDGVSWLNWGAMGVRRWQEMAGLPAGNGGAFSFPFSFLLFLSSRRTCKIKITTVACQRRRESTGMASPGARREGTELGQLKALVIVLCTSKSTLGAFSEARLKCSVLLSPVRVYLLCLSVCLQQPCHSCSASSPTWLPSPMYVSKWRPQAAI